MLIGVGVEPAGVIVITPEPNMFMGVSPFPETKKGAGGGAVGGAA